MPRERLIPPNPVVMPKPITGQMPRGDAQDPPVAQIALDAAREIDRQLSALLEQPKPQRVSRIQILVEAAIGDALDRMQTLGGQRVR